MQEEILDFLRNPFVVFSISFLLTFCVVSGSQQLGDVVELEFPAYRLQQFEVSGNMYGSKNYRVSYEAVSLDGRTLRRCVVTTWRDVVKAQDDIFELTAGGMLIFIPADLDNLNEKDKALFVEFENKLKNVRTDLAVYVSPSSEERPSILNDVVATSGKAATATQQLVNSIAANTFQVTSSDPQPGDAINYKPVNIVGRLSSGERSSPTIVFVAHYDSHSVLPGLSVGADSNGSGVVALLELLAVLSKFYEQRSTRPPYNLIFVWTAAGKLNYQGARQWIDDYQVAAGHADSSTSIDIVLCLEAIGRNSKNLYMHSSKTPSDDSTAAKILRRLQAVSPGEVEVVTKKISLTSANSWEHEKFNIKRTQAVTLSSYATHADEQRNSVFDSSIDVEELMINIRAIAEAVLGYMLQLPEGGVSSDPRVTAESSMLSRDAINKHRVNHFIRQFASKPRPLGDKASTTSISSNLAAAAAGYSQVSTSQVTLVDARAFGTTTNKLVAERVKPAVFELVIASGVFAYLYAFYYFATHAQKSIEGTVAKIRKGF